MTSKRFKVSTESFEVSLQSWKENFKIEFKTQKSGD